MSEPRDCCVEGLEYILLYFRDKTNYTQVEFDATCKKCENKMSILLNVDRSIEVEPIMDKLKKEGITYEVKYK